MPLVLDGSKTVTWRIFDDKDLRVGDRLSFVNSATDREFAKAEIITIREKKLGDIAETDFAEGHERYQNQEEMLATYRSYYGNTVDYSTIIKIIRFELREMKLYKYRPLATCEDYSRAQEILKTGKFWCAKFYKLNDPMEGVYLSKGFNQERIKELFDSKAKFSICSFSTTYTEPIMWTHYSSGFRGIVIEITMNQTKVHRIIYSNNISVIRDAIVTHKNDLEEEAKQILTNKLDIWSHEKEFRYLTTNQEGNHKIGKITGLITWSNDSIQNHNDLDRSRQTRCDYEEYGKFLINLAKNKKIPHSRAEMNNEGMISLISQD